MEKNRPDVTVVEKKTVKCQMTDPSFLFDTRVKKKGTKNMVQTLWKLKNVEVVFEALGTVLGRLRN